MLVRSLRWNRVGGENGENGEVSTLINCWWWCSVNGNISYSRRAIVRGNEVDLGNKRSSPQDLRLAAEKRSRKKKSVHM